MVAIIPRSAWGARYPNGAVGKNGQPIVAPLPAREVWLHHSVTVAPDLVPPFADDDAAVRTLELIGQQRFGQGISYTWPITPVGRVYEGHSVNRQGAHTGGRNSIARAICFVGNCDANRPTPQMIESAAQLLVQEFRAGRIVAARLNGGHQNAPGASTSCPGRYGMEAIPKINARAAAILGGAPTQEDDDMPSLAEIHDAVWHGAPGAKLVTNHRLSRGEWAGTILGALEKRVRDEILPPALAELKGEIAGLQAALTAIAAAPASSVDVEAVFQAAQDGARSIVDNLRVVADPDPEA